MSLSFRDATEADAIRLLYWRNEDAAVQASGQQRTITFAEHMSWLHDMLHSSARLYVVRDVAADVWAGTCRIEVVERQATISLTVDPAQRGHGYAGRMIDHLLGEALRAGATVARAVVRESNYPSLRAFWQAGFRVGEMARTDGGLITLQLVLHAEETAHGPDGGTDAAGAAEERPGAQGGTRGAAQRPKRHRPGAAHKTDAAG